MIHELVDALCATVTIWIGYKIGHAERRAQTKVIPPAPAPAPAPAPKPETKKPVVYARYAPSDTVTCPKCGSEARYAKTGTKEKGFYMYCPGSLVHDFYGCSVSCHAAHFTRFCKRCSFEWFEATKDSMPVPAWVKEVPKEDA